ncbi:class D beta-lactamase [Xanthobacter autotrophicus]|uniref:penicillin-binding transpeptidase domain-containing protein n=1 Tax=Xanthobacter TaxID=279 RepID=UPI0024AA9BC8|nr:penicillin-binding transpeptidase domain-containing protein [Xanthobacter autotrophicus]MDI4664996.1 class D beta-lactamase [Xanthobacter autotrophicus]
MALPRTGRAVPWHASGPARLRRAALGLVLALAATALAAPARAAEDCFIATDLDTGRVLAKQGLCATRHPPNSTFKIALALMGYDAGLLKNEAQPVFSPPPGEEPERAEARGPQTPRSWMENSVVWYSQILARRLGPERIAGYLKGFAYGNENMGGLKGEAEPLVRFWLSSSLRLSPREQIDFLRRMLNGTLPVSAEAVAATERLMVIDEQPAGWLVFGKTGSGNGRLADGGLDRGRPFGWFVGFARKEARTVVFVRFTALDIASPEPLGPLAKRQALAILAPVLSAQAP